MSMRSRNIKPGFFTNELLAVSDPMFQVIYAGLWCFCDREGRCEDRPARIHMTINPGRAFETTARAIDWLADNKFILRYAVNGRPLIQVIQFRKHQNPHRRESPSTLSGPGPAFESLPDPLGPSQALPFGEHSATEGQLKASNGHDLGQSLDVKSGLGTAKSPADSLIPDSLIPDSGFLIPDTSVSGPKRGCRIPEPFEITQAMQDWAKEHTPGLDLTQATEEFVDYWRGVTGRNATKADWPGTWRNRMRELFKREAKTRAPRKTAFEQLQERRHGNREEN